LFQAKKQTSTSTETEKRTNVSSKRSFWVMFFMLLGQLKFRFDAKIFLFILMNWLFESCGKVDSWLSELK
jgi:hypothetical protein